MNRQRKLLKKNLVMVIVDLNTSIVYGRISFWVIVAIMAGGLNAPGISSLVAKVSGRKQEIPVWITYRIREVVSIKKTLQLL